MTNPGFPIITFLLAFSLTACSGNGNGSGDGSNTACGEGMCPSGNSCVNDSICVPTPQTEANGCIEDHDNIFKVDSAANLDCHNTTPCEIDADCFADGICKNQTCAMTPPVGDFLPATVTFRGCVDAFGIGDTTHQMRVALYRGSADPTGNSSWDAATSKDQENCKYWGAFEFSDVPTNTPLILKSYDEQNDFMVTYKVNLVLWADLATDDGSGTFVFDTRDNILDPRSGLTIPLHPYRGYALSRTTYNVILMAVGMSDVSPGHGAVAGTIRDCRYRELDNISCGFSPDPSVVTYFTNTSSPRPDQNRSSTNLNGIYAAIELPQGSNRVTCLARDPAGNLVPLGEYSFGVWDQGITILSFDWYPGI